MPLILKTVLFLILLYHSPKRVGTGGQLAGFGLGPQPQGEPGQLPPEHSSPDSLASQASGNTGEKKVVMLVVLLILLVVLLAMLVVLLAML